MLKDAASRAQIAGGRAALYDLLIRILGHLPDRRFLDILKGPELEDCFGSGSDLGHAGFESGWRRIAAYRSAVQDRPCEEVITELSVDRTRLLRGTGEREMQPPYEGLYRKKECRAEVGTSVLEVKRFYRRAGLLPDETLRESPDYLCVELDFMRQLCLREKRQWAFGDSAEETLRQEEAFLRDHLGSWVGEFCRQASAQARTDFYGGVMGLLAAFVAMEMQYLGDSVR